MRMSMHPLDKCPYCGEDRVLLTVNEATQVASVNRKTIYRWIRAGSLEHCLLPSGAIRIFKDSLIRPPGGEPEHAHPEAMREEGAKAGKTAGSRGTPAERPPSRPRPKRRVV
jgi:excisionase family DNA binding protein